MLGARSVLGAAKDKADSVSRWPEAGGYGERFVRTDGEVWHALRDSFHLDGTACLSARVDGAVPRWHDLDDGKGTHQFVVRQFGGRWWGRAIREHSMAYEVELDLTQAELENSDSPSNDG